MKDYRKITIECDLTDAMTDPFDGSCTKCADELVLFVDGNPEPNSLSAAMRFSAQEYAEHAWQNHDMWECPEGFEVIVRAIGFADPTLYSIGIESVPAFNATRHAPAKETKL